MFRIKRNETVPFGGEQIEIPKLTIEKYQLLIAQMEVLPSLLMSIWGAKGTVDLATTIIAASQLAGEEVSRLVGVLTGKDPEWIRKDVAMNEVIHFLKETAKKNDLVEAAKKCRAALLKWSGNQTAPVDKSHSTNG
jgi:hypothetical protein